ncbi:glycoside hydrolase, partial [Micromonospora sp. CPCC 205371]|nr:glycoside hydrolase [Micromonospora sp. CPCC 205371]
PTRRAGERATTPDATAQPPLARTGDRARRRRRQRHAARAGVAAVALAVAGIVALRPWSAEPEPPPPADNENRTVAPVYTDQGITINGLSGEVPDVPGMITEVEFADPDTGYLIAQCLTGDPCSPTLARTSDGGHSWVTATLPPIETDPDLLVFPDGRLAVGGHVSADEGRTWQAAPGRAGQPAAAGPQQILRLRDAVEVWDSGYGYSGTLATQPGLTASWLASTPTASGDWWAAGQMNGQAAVAVTRDGGRSWKAMPLGVTGQIARVATLGTHVYAAVLDANGLIRAIFYSVDSGATFQKTSTGGGSVAGDLVPLLDGRLLVVGTDRRWYVSDDNGRTFARAEGTLPAAGRLVRTPAGYVAYDLFNAGWAAFSADGSTWRKLQIN